MSLLFAHDHTFSVYNGKVYSNQFSYEIIKRYIGVFGNVTFLARKKDISYKETDNLKEAEGDGVSFIFVESISSIKSYFGLRQSLKDMINNLICENDKIIVRLPSEIGVFVSQLARNLRVNYAVEAVGCAWDSMFYYGGLKSKLYTPVYAYKMYIAVKNASAVLYVTESFLQQRYPPDKLASIVNISNVELPSLDNNIPKSLIRIKASCNEPIVIGTIGSLKSNYKGVDVALRSLKILRDKGYNVIYEVVGDGDIVNYQRVANELGVFKYVKFLGAIPKGSAVQKWLFTLDIYIQPSLTEGLPRALIEAMQVGCPSIATKVGGIPELLQEEYLVDKGNYNQLSDKIEMMINNADKADLAIRYNVNKSKYYEKSNLDLKRLNFWGDFKARS